MRVFTDQWTRTTDLGGLHRWCVGCVGKKGVWGTPRKRSGRRKKIFHLLAEISGSGGTLAAQAKLNFSYKNFQKIPCFPSGIFSLNFHLWCVCFVSDLEFQGGSSVEKKSVLSFYFTYEELKHIDTINDELSWCEFLLYL